MVFVDGSRVSISTFRSVSLTSVCVFVIDVHLLGLVMVPEFIHSFSLLFCFCVFFFGALFPPPFCRLGFDPCVRMH